MAYEDDDVTVYAFKDKILRMKFKNDGRVLKVAKIINNGKTLVFERKRSIHFLRNLQAYGVPKIILDNTNAETIVIHEDDNENYRRLYSTVEQFRELGLT